MYLHPLPQPVGQAYGGGDTLEVRKLQEFCDRTIQNFNLMQSELTNLKLRHADQAAINKQLVQLLNWIATTNPQILDEFQTTATAFDKLVPRDDGGGPYASAQA